MKKGLIIFSILILLFTVSCTPKDINQDSNETIKVAPIRTQENSTSECKPPYLQIIGDCCLDSNQNGECDYGENPPSNEVQQTQDSNEQPTSQQDNVQIQQQTNKQECNSGTPNPQTNFFVGEPSTTGGNLGGLNGADQKCQQWANSIGLGSKTWRAYLSTSSVNARDRIGNGPWRDYCGNLIANNLNELHTKGVSGNSMYDISGSLIWYKTTNQQDHDILTGSTNEGTLAPFPGNPDAPSPTCNDWTAGENTGGFYGIVGHTDWDIEGGSGFWNNAHETSENDYATGQHLTDSSCSQVGLGTTAGKGRIYCFATN